LFYVFIHIYISAYLCHKLFMVFYLKFRRNRLVFCLWLLFHIILFYRYFKGFPINKLTDANDIYVSCHWSMFRVLTLVSLYWCSVPGRVQCHLIFSIWHNDWFLHIGNIFWKFCLMILLPWFIWIAKVTLLFLFHVVCWLDLVYCV
jgi:hypothetical protein